MSEGAVDICQLPCYNIFRIGVLEYQEEIIGSSME